MYAAAAAEGKTRIDANASPRVLSGWLERRPEQLWIDLQEPTAEQLHFIRDRFTLHPLAIEECDHTGVRPKIEEFEDHLYLVLRGVNHNPGEDSLDGVEFKVFLRPGLLITIHDSPSTSIQTTQERLQRDPQLLPRSGVDTVLHRIVDAIVDHYFPILETMEERLEALECDIFRNLRPEILEELLVMQRRFLTLQRVIHPQLDILSALSSGRFTEIEKADLAYFRDVFDHLHRISDRVHVAREMLNGVMQCYLSQTSNQMNTAMKGLAVLAAVMLPASTITGLLGMNLDHLPGRSAPGTFGLVSVAVVAASVLLLVILKRLRWL